MATMIFVNGQLINPTPPPSVDPNAKCGKTRPQDKPYEVWRDASGQWEWKVLKKYQKDDKKPFARAFCAVKGPGTFGSYELGDTYCAEYQRYGTLVETNYDEANGTK
jgi:hypothetical protein